MTGEVFKNSEKAEHPEELLCVQSFYEMNPDADDRPEHIKKKSAQEMAARVEILAKQQQEKENQANAENKPDIESE